MKSNKVIMMVNLSTPFAADAEGEQVLRATKDSETAAGDGLMRNKCMKLLVGVMCFFG